MREHRPEVKASLAENAHLVFAIAATILAVSIAVTGMAVIVEQKWLWAAGGIGALIGAGFLVAGLSQYL